MVKKLVHAVAAITIGLCLNGCWDQRELKNIRTVHTAGIDLLSNGKVRLTVSIPTIKTSFESQGSVVTPRISEEGRNIQEASVNLQKTVSQHMDLRETRVLLVSEKFARNNLYEALDFYYREAHFPISVYIAITESSAQKITQLEVEDRSLISEYLYDLLVSSEQEGIIPKESPFLISSIMVTPGKDNVLPYLTLSQKNSRATVEGVALFHDKKMTGKLDDPHTRVFVVLSNKKTYGSITEQVGLDDTYVTFTYKSSRSRMKLDVKGKAITAHLYAKMEFNLMDNPSGEKLSKEELDRMTAELEQLLKGRAEETVQQLKKANCDGLGIGLHLKAKHNKQWKSIKWSSVYPTITIIPHLHISIVDHGLLE